MPRSEYSTLEVVGSIVAIYLLLALSVIAFLTLAVFLIRITL